MTVHWPKSGGQKQPTDKQNQTYDKEVKRVVNPAKVTEVMSKAEQAKVKRKTDANKANSKVASKQAKNRRK